MIITGIIILLLIAIIAFFLVKTAEVNKGRKTATEKYAKTAIQKITDRDYVNSLSILPLVESESDSKDLETENGVSYLITIDGKHILLDFGFNRKKKHPSPLLHNMEILGKSFDHIDYIVFSHAHLDHLGGMHEQKTKTFSISQGPVETPTIPVYAPVPLKPSGFNPQLNKVTVSRDPVRIIPGVYTTGTIPRSLFIMGWVEEQALAIRLKDKGVVLILGCGHQTIQRVIERTKKLFEDPVYGVFGGLHLPVLKRGNISTLGLIQWIVGSDRPLWKGLSEKDVYEAIESLLAENVQRVGLSPHDSSPWSIGEFKKAFGEKYVEIMAGKEIKL